MNSLKSGLESKKFKVVVLTILLTFAAYAAKIGPPIEVTLALLALVGGYLGLQMHLDKLKGGG